MAKPINRSRTQAGKTRRANGADYPNIEEEPIRVIGGEERARSSGGKPRKQSRQGSAKKKKKP